MPNWERTPPVSGMGVEEIKKRVADGIKRRRQTGELRPEGLKDVVMVNDGPGFTKKERIALIQHSELAITALANHDMQDYCNAVEVMRCLCKKAGMPKTLISELCKGIESQVAELIEEPVENVSQVARRALQQFYSPSDKLISIPKGKTNGNNEGQRPKASPGSPPDKSN